MRIAIVGVTGGVGSALAQQALAQHHEVVGVARRPEAVSLSHPRLHLKAGSAEQAASLAAALPGCDVVVSAVGTGGLLQARKPTTLYSTLAESLLPAMQAGGVERVIAVTAGGIVESPDWPWFYRLIIHPMLREMYVDMNRMEQRIRQAGVRHLFVRPVRLIPGRRRRRYRIEPERTPPKGFLISRADVADYILRRIEADDYVSGGVGIAY